MRLLGNIQFLKVSYVVLVAVPLLVLLQHKLDLPWEGLKNVPTILKLTYFSSLFLACAHMVYQGFCPSEIKRFDSPNDLYHDLLRIKTMERRSGGDDPAFSFDYDHCLNGFDSANVEFWFARLLCWVFYTAGIVLFGVVIVIQALRVLGVFLL